MAYKSVFSYFVFSDCKSGSWLSAWRRVVGFAAASILVSAWAFTPRVTAQTVGPITPNQAPDQSGATQQAPPPAPALVAKTNLAGVWKLNRDESDDPREKMREAANNSGGFGGPRSGGQGGGANRGGGWGGLGIPGGQGPWGGGQGGNRGGANRGNSGDARGGAMDTTDLSQLTIEQSETTAKVTGTTGRILAVYSSSDPDASNKPTKKASDDSTYTPPAARLQDGHLVVVTQGRRGEKTTRTYALSPDRTQLDVTTKLENPRFSQPVVIRFVYDQAKSATSN